MEPGERRGAQVRDCLRVKCLEALHLHPVLEQVQVALRAEPMLQHLRRGAHVTEPGASEVAAAAATDGHGQAPGGRRRGREIELVERALEGIVRLEWTRVDEPADARHDAAGSERAADLAQHRRAARHELDDERRDRDVDAAVGHRQLASVGGLEPQARRGPRRAPRDGRP